MREQVQRERCELLSTLLLLYELPSTSSGGGSIQCSGHRVLELVRMVGGAVFAAAGPAAGGGGGVEEMQGVVKGPHPAEASSTTAMAEQMVGQAGHLISVAPYDLLLA